MNIEIGILYKLDYYNDECIVQVLYEHSPFKGDKPLYPRYRCKIIQPLSPHFEGLTDGSFDLNFFVKRLGTLAKAKKNFPEEFI